MAWCLQCHYGSEVCELVPAGGTDTFKVAVPGIVDKYKVVENPLLKCPQCGLISAQHCMKSPFKGVKMKDHKTHKGKKKDRVQVREQEEQESKD